MAKEKLYVVKIGGNIIENGENLLKFLDDFSSLKGNKILVHGGGKDATKRMEELGLVANFVNGRRVTDENTLIIVDQVYRNLNTEIVIQLYERGCKAIGFTGIAKMDGTIVITAKKRAPLDGTDYGYVGDIIKENINGVYLNQKLKEGYIPVFSPLVFDVEASTKVGTLNTNADTIAMNVSTSLSHHYDVDLIFCFELKGVLRDFEDKNSVIASLDKKEYESLKSKGIIAKGMVPKMDNSFQAISAGVKSVRICHADDLKSIINEGKQLGTVLN